MRTQTCVIYRRMPAVRGSTPSVRIDLTYPSSFFFWQCSVSGFLLCVPIMETRVIKRCDTCLWFAMALLETRRKMLNVVDDYCIHKDHDIPDLSPNTLFDPRMALPLVPGVLNARRAPKRVYLHYDQCHVTSVTPLIFCPPTSFPGSPTHKLARWTSTNIPPRAPFTRSRGGYVPANPTASPPSRAAAQARSASARWGSARWPPSSSSLLR
jgi:hypothetical protein